MKRVITKARRVALRKIPVVIEGESGTGKELLARAIHYSSPRKQGPFQAKNCGAIPADLVESDFFGHEKGAFSGAHATHRGVFEVANGGTVFLDEIGELPLLAQVKLLRVLAEGEVTRLGSTTPLRVDVRIIAATNRKLVDEIQAGHFREDLFHRLAGLVVTLPPLRERAEDIPLLLDEMLTKVNKECEGEPGYEPKVLSVAARNHAKHYRWPGNVRELYSTLLRAAVFTVGSRIELADFQENLLAVDNHPRDHLLERPLGDGFSLPKLLSEVERHYLSRGMDEAGKNMTQAAELLGFASYQTLSNRLKKNGLYS
jgi:DNA-binding NtrC family response regulator